MDQREIVEQKSEAKGGSFFYDQWKLLQTRRETPKVDRTLHAVAVDPAEEAKKSLDRYKLRLKEYRQYQIAHRALMEKTASAPAEEKARLQQGLRHLEAKLDFLEKELKNGHARTKTAVQELRVAS